MNSQELDKVFKDQLSDAPFTPDDHLKDVIFQDLKSSFWKSPWQKVMQIIGGNPILSTVVAVTTLSTTLYFSSSNEDSSTMASSAINDTNSIYSSTSTAKKTAVPFRTVLFTPVKNENVQPQTLNSNKLSMKNYPDVQNVTVISDNGGSKKAPFTATNTNGSEPVTSLNNGQNVSLFDDSALSGAVGEQYNYSKMPICSIKKLENQAPEISSNLASETIEITQPHGSNPVIPLNGGRAISLFDYSTLSAPSEEQYDYSEMPSCPIQKLENQTPDVLLNLASENIEIEGLHAPLKNHISFQINALAGYGYNGENTFSVPGILLDNEPIPFYGDEMFLDFLLFGFMEYEILRSTEEKSYNFSLGYERMLKWNFFAQTKLDIAQSTIKLTEKYMTPIHFQQEYFYDIDGTVLDTFSVVKYGEDRLISQQISNFNYFSTSLSFGAGRLFELYNSFSFSTSAGANLRINRFTGNHYMPIMSFEGPEYITATNVSVHPYLNTELRYDFGNYGITAQGNFTTNMTSDNFKIGSFNEKRIRAYVGIGGFFQF